MRFKRFWFLTAGIVLISAASGVKATLAVLSRSALNLRRRDRGINVDEDHGLQRRRPERVLPILPQPSSQPVPPVRPSVAYVDGNDNLRRDQPESLLPVHPQPFPQTAPTVRPAVSNSTPPDSPAYTSIPEEYPTVSGTIHTAEPPSSVSDYRIAESPQIEHTVLPVEPPPLPTHQNGPVNPPAYTATLETTFTIQSPPLSLNDCSACEGCSRLPPPIIQEGIEYARWLREHADHLRVHAEECNEKASEVYFKSHNPHITEEFSGTVDLHNQKVKKALALTKEYVEKARQDGIKELRFIVGKGKHTDGWPVLGQRVSQALKKLGIDAAVDKTNRGVIVARLSE